ncbi:phosphotransferase KptA/Tpt1, partial [Kickxella alabastrina]|uniref:phosphotransferase KptA/Tpt1 n=1 Tax=Kickxella alabastrina TaxID=61397 RepID=UPI00221F93E7
NSRRHPGRQTRRGADDSPEVKLSKFLSYVLRHGASKEGLTLRDDGSILLSTLQQHKKLQSTTFAQIKHIVDTNDKKRFTLFEEEANEVGSTRVWYIRATQGHSVDIKAPPLVLLTEETVPRHIIHGTTREKVPVIQKDGLSRMQRTHIHFATGLAGDQEVVSGMRKTSDAFIYIDFPRAMQDGIEFYVSENNVILSRDCVTLA